MTGTTTPAELAREVFNAMWMTLKKLLVAVLVMTDLGRSVGLNSPITATGAGNDPIGDPPPVNTIRPVVSTGAKSFKQPDPKKELEKLKGAWQVSSLTMGGERIPEDIAKKMILTFGEDKVTFTGKLAQSGGQFVVNDGSSEFPYTIDAKKKVAEIEIEVKGKEPAKGIYKFDGGDLILCVDYSRADRPAKFETKDNPAYVLYRLKKAK